MLNIPSTVASEDPHYRYRMPKMQLRVEGKGGDIKTNILNLEEVAQSLNTNPMYVLKFMAYEKGSLAVEKGDKEGGKKQGVSFILRGSFAYEELLRILDKFIDIYILCPNKKCRHPEMSIFVQNGRVKGICDECTFCGQLNNAHKIASYIVKNPPEKIPDSLKKAKKQQQKPGKQKNEKTKVSKKIEQEQEKTEITIKQQKNLQSSKQTIKTSISLIRNHLTHQKQTQPSLDFSIASAYTVQFIKSLSINKIYLSHIIFNSLFELTSTSTSTNFVEQIGIHRELYLKLMDRVAGFSEEEEEEIGANTLVNLEYMILGSQKQKENEEIIARIPHILAKLYKEDIISEEFVVKWAKRQLKLDSTKYWLYDEARDQLFLEKASKFVVKILQNYEQENENEQKGEEN